jgi:hypothetical protein
MDVVDGADDNPLSFCAERSAVAESTPAGAMDVGDIAASRAWILRLRAG